MNRCFFLSLVFLLLLGGPPASAAPTAQVRAGIDHAPWDALLKKYVDERGLVGYARWRENAADQRALDDYLLQFAVLGGVAAAGDEEIASLINAYNAFTIRWILQNYPTESIRELDDSWSEPRWTVGGRAVSLDEIEHKNLRPLYGWRVHAAIVCAARSCPPLQRQAFTAANLRALTEAAYRAWLGRDDLNRYDAPAGRVQVSAIFKWFKDDFTGEAGLASLLARYGPERYHDFFVYGSFKVDYLDYNWGLNDQGGRGADYHPGFLRRFF